MRKFNEFPRETLAITPTPIEKLPRFSRELSGPNIYIKRDDNTGLALGGNKARKLEYLIADAKNKGADVVLTEGGIQSNHARMTAAAARRVGMKPILVLKGDKIEDYQGNLFIDRLLDAEIIRVDPEDSTGRRQTMYNKAEELKQEGKTPYVIPTGGSTGLGALGFINCAREIKNQAEDMEIEFDWIIHPIGSGGTQAGLIAGKQIFGGNYKIMGIAADNEDFAPEIQKIGQEINKLIIEKVNITEDDIKLNYNYYGPKYGVPSEKSINAMKLLSRNEGILVGPIYTGKALAGLIDLSKKGHFNNDDNILFLHTGGTPAMFAFDIVDQL